MYFLGSCLGQPVEAVENETLAVDDGLTGAGVLVAKSLPSIVDVAGDD